MGYLRNTKDAGKPPIAEAEDAGVRVVIPPHLMIEKSWIDLLPDEQQVLFELDWEPVEPKHPLVQLAEVLDDWIEDV